MSLPSSAGNRGIIPNIRGRGTTRFRSMTVVRVGQQAAMAVDGVLLMDAPELPTAIIADFLWGAHPAYTAAVL